MNMSVISRIILAPLWVLFFVATLTAVQAQSSITGSYDFAWQANKSDEGVSLSGSVPSEAIQRFLIIRAGEGATIDLNVAKGAPQSFISFSIAGLDALKKLNSGQFAVKDDAWSLQGTVANPDLKSDILAVLGLAVDTSAWEISIDVAPEVMADLAQEVKPTASIQSQPDPAPAIAYEFNALRADGGQITLSGNLPGEAFANYISKISGGASTQSIQYLSETPENFRINIITGLQALGELRSGLLAFDNGQWTLVGDAIDSATRASARWKVFALDGSEDWVLDIATVPGLEICNISVAQFAQTKTILFAPASAQLTAESEQNVMDFALDLNACPNAIVYVSGHTDADGPADANMALSVSRAEAVIATLIEAGVSDTRLYAVGYGETLPIATNDTRAGKAQNRRIVFELKAE